MRSKSLLLCFLFAMTALLSGCGSMGSLFGGGKIEVDRFGELPDGRAVTRFTLTNRQGMSMELLDYGAIMHSLSVADREGNFADVLLSCETLQCYVDQSPYFGSIAGRYANRIALGQFTIDGEQFQLATNNDAHHLHGGNVGFDKVMWKGNAVRERGAVGVRFTYESKDGEEGYPGSLSCSVLYTLTGDNEFHVSYEARTDKATPINLTQHNYYNLAGQGSGDVLGHGLTIWADRFLPVDSGGIPTGALAAVQGTPMDFTDSHAIGDRIGEVTGGYDHNYVLNSNDGTLALAARVSDPGSGRVMEIWTTEPGIQFYTGNFLDGTITGKAGRVYHQNYGLCLETQHFPDSPNRASFPSTILRPGEVYRHRTVHRFSVQ